MKTKEQIEQEVRKEFDDFPDGVYDHGSFLCGKELSIELEIEFRKQIQELCDEE